MPRMSKAEASASHEDYVAKSRDAEAAMLELATALGMDLDGELLGLGHEVMQTTTPGKHVARVSVSVRIVRDIVARLAAAKPSSKENGP